MLKQESSNAFVVLPPQTSKAAVIFGKNSNRPSGEVQELIYESPKQCNAEETVKCTYIDVEQVEKTYGVILSKPAWMWGCEMGANDQGLAIGSGLVLTKILDKHQKSLLGTDLVRLALERSKTSEEAVGIITNLLSEYGQGGVYSDESPNSVYCSTFLIADAKEAWVVETVGKHWVAQKISSGFKSISNKFTIETKFDKSSSGLLSFAKENNVWNGEEDFNFSDCFGVSNGEPLEKHLAGQELLEHHSQTGSFSVKDMFAILRNKDENICNGLDSPFPTAASQVSMLSVGKPCCHWFTATPDPTISVFKPFIFTPNVKISSHSKSAEDGDRCHALYSLHAAAVSSSNNKVISLLQNMEINCLEEVEKFLDEYKEGQSLSEVDELLKDIVETEVKFYK